MEIKSLKKLPPRAQNMFKALYNVAKQTTNELNASKVALQLLTENYKPIPRNGRKSIAAQPFGEAGESKIHGTYVDVILGYPGMDIQAENGGLKLADNGWQRVPSGILKGDYEHIYADKAEGVYNEYIDDWEGWVPVAQRFWVNDNGLNARVELPSNHPKTEIFSNEWKAGELGLSVDYAYPEEAVEYTEYDGRIVPEAKEWFVTGFTFTKTPSYEKTKTNE